jgi:hypothetical protein
MNWPLPTEFNEAVQTPTLAFADPDLKTGQATVGPMGLPLPRSGNFADVYQIRGANGRDWAVKCFTRPVPGLDDRYRKVGAALAKADLSFTVGFTFLGEGIKVRGRWLPALKMEWVEGLLLNQFVRENAGSPAALLGLLRSWVKLCQKLRAAGVAHADLQHGNALLVPGSKPGTVTIRLIDYDGMYVPALANTPSGENGHANFQHPLRGPTNAYSPDLDRFPHLVIATALKALAVLGPPLWEKYDTGDNLLFTDADFKNPGGSKLMRELWAAGDPGLSALVGHLALACGRPIPQTPWLDQIAPDGEPAPLQVSRPAAEPLPPPEPPAAPARTAYRPRRPARSWAPAAVVGGFFLLAAVIALIAYAGKKSHDTAEGDSKPPAQDQETRTVSPLPVTSKKEERKAASVPPPPVVDPPAVVVAPAPRRVATATAGPEVAPPPRVAVAKPDKPPPNPVARLPVPKDDALDKAEAELRAVYKEDYARKTAADRKALAAKLLALADKTPDDPAARFVMLREARDLAAEAVDVPLAMQAIDGLGKWYAADAAGMRYAALEKVYASTVKQDVLRAVADAAGHGADAAQDADDYDGAVKLATLAVMAVRKGALGRIALEDADFRLAAAKKTRDAFLAAKPAFDTLAAKPDDPAANAAVGRFRCFVQGRWAEGVKNLAKGDHPQLKAAAALELATETELPDVKQGDAWWDFAASAPEAEKKPAEGRARHWYHKVFDELTGIPRARAEKRLGFTASGVDYLPGLVAEYGTSKGAPLPKEKRARVEPGIDFPAPDLADVGRNTELVGRWAGVVVVPRPGRYKFVFDTRHPVRVRVGGSTVIDTLKDKSGRRDVALLMTDKPTVFSVEVFARGDERKLRPTWVPPGRIEEEPIPAECLYHDRKAESVIGK